MENKELKDLLKEANNQLQLKARFSYNINVYMTSIGNDVIEVKEDIFPRWCFIKGDKKQCKEFLEDIAKLCGVEVEIK